VNARARVVPSWSSVPGHDRTPNAGTHGLTDIEALVVDAFAQLGTEARLLAGVSDSAADLILGLDGAQAAIRSSTALWSPMSWPRG
jgi:hypothetical protein